ncbi:hypothetical protein WHR41_02091 [Cladosporium halotolerans]|uniref:Rhodopsin domain-containing protein n=1 Tax=Cladosporium halotolerans TaxID=1052096 RepID=A0AB34KVT6_9PEZI
MRQYPPFAVVSETDHTAWIIIAAAIGIPIILIFGGIRLAVRQPVNIGLDDALIGGSTLVAIVQASLVLRACSYGFGKESAQIDRSLLTRVQELYYGSNILLLISLALSKASVAALLLRLCIEKTQKKYFTGALAFVALWGLCSIFAVALQCNLSKPAILFDGECSYVLLRWQIIGGMDIAWEVLVVAMAAYLMWNLQAPLATKIQVVFAFSFRLLLIAPIAFRFHTFPEARLAEDPSLPLASFVAWTQAELY